MLTENWMMKLLSLIFALVLWFFVMGEQDLEKGFAVPVELSSLPEGLIVSNDVPSLLDVRISGPRTVLMNLQQSDLAIDIDLEGLTPGVTSYKRLEELFNLSRVASRFFTWTLNVEGWMLDVRPSGERVS